MRLAALPGAAAILLSTAASAQGREPAVSLQDCPVLDGAQIERILKAELHAYLMSRAEAVTLVDVRCEDYSAHITVNDASTNKSTSRSIDLSTVPPLARSRTLALAVAELVAWSWTELVFARTDPAAPTSARPLPARSGAPADERTIPRQAPPPGTRWELLGSARMPLVERHLMVGGGLALSAVAAGFDWDADILAHATNLDIPQGGVDVFSLDGRLGWGLSYRDRWLAIGVSIGARGGLLRYQATVNDANRYDAGSLMGSWVGPSLLTSLRASTGASLHLVIAGEVGYAAWTPRGTLPGAVNFDLSGPWLSLRAGFGIGS